jgi:metal-dependent amidase/aminoacylase/carboxypeptidase family protein
MEKETLKQTVIKAIDEKTKQIKKIGDDLWKIPEVGFREYKTNWH